MVDWLPSILSIAVRGIGATRSRSDWTALLEPREPPRQLGDGIDNSRMITDAAPSARSELIHEAHPLGSEHEGHGSALRVGRYKLLTHVRSVFWVTRGLTQPGERHYSVQCAFPPPDPSTVSNGSADGSLLFDIVADRECCLASVVGCTGVRVSPCSSVSRCIMDLVLRSVRASRSEHERAHRLGQSQGAAGAVRTDGSPGRLRVGRRNCCLW